MTGAGIGAATASALLTGTGYLQFGGKVGFVNDFSNWNNGVPIIGFGDPQFACWFNGTAYADIGGASVLPISATGVSVGAGTLIASVAGTGKGESSGAGTLTGTGALAGGSKGGSSGGGTIGGSASMAGTLTGFASGTGLLTGSGTMTGSGAGFGLGTGKGVAPGPPAAVSYRIASPRQPSSRGLNFTSLKWYQRRVSSREEKQRVLTS